MSCSSIKNYLFERYNEDYNVLSENENRVIITFDDSDLSVLVNKKENKMFIILFLALAAFDFLCTAGLVWLFCWLLPAIGIASIGSFAIVFSWKLALAIWIVLLLLRSLFTVGSKG